MRYFLCTLNSQPAAVQLAIPMRHTERIITVEKTRPVKSGNGEKAEVFVSLLALLEPESADATHGIILRSERAPKIVLLAPQIDRDLEIPEESIHQLPNAFLKLSDYFRGAFFDEQTLILLLNTEKIMADHNDYA